MPTQIEDAGRLPGGALARIVYSEEEIARRVREMGQAITRSYAADARGHADADDLLVLGLLKGSFIFLADLVRAIDRPLHVDFLVASSYGSATKSGGDVRLLYQPKADIEGRDVVVVEDIVDSGNTLRRLVPLLRERGPRSLEICTLLHKRLTELDPEPRWVGFEPPPDFLVGYGLDFSESFRHLPYIGVLDPSVSATGDGDRIRAGRAPSNG